MDFTEQERAVLRMVQADLPDSLTPYADMAAETGMSEQDVIALLSRLKEDGSIRRFGASIKHQKTGWSHNAMVAWIADEALADEAGPIAARHPRVSHCYFRPSFAPDWPYTFYTMVHGKSAKDCAQVVEELRRDTPLHECAMLESLKELKKISMTYF